MNSSSAATLAVSLTAAHARSASFVGDAVIVAEKPRPLLDPFHEPDWPGFGPQLFSCPEQSCTDSTVQLEFVMAPPRNLLGTPWGQSGLINKPASNP